MKCIHSLFSGAWHLPPCEVPGVARQHPGLLPHSAAQGKGRELRSESRRLKERLLEEASRWLVKFWWNSGEILVKFWWNSGWMVKKTLVKVHETTYRWKSLSTLCPSHCKKTWLAPEKWEMLKFQSWRFWCCDSLMQPMFLVQSVPWYLVVPQVIGGMTLTLIVFSTNKLDKDPWQDVAAGYNLNSTSKHKRIPNIIRWLTNLWPALLARLRIVADLVSLDLPWTYEFWQTLAKWVEDVCIKHFFFPELRRFVRRGRAFVARHSGRHSCVHFCIWPNRTRETRHGSKSDSKSDFPLNRWFTRHTEQI